MNSQTIPKDSQPAPDQEETKARKLLCCWLNIYQVIWNGRAC
jgi:hypothetical protein